MGYECICSIIIIIITLLLLLLSLSLLLLCVADATTENCTRIATYVDITAMYLC
jgi:hypothetical protein